MINAYPNDQMQASFLWHNRWKRILLGSLLLSTVHMFSQSNGPFNSSYLVVGQKEDDENCPS